MRNPSRASRIAGSMRVFQGELTEPAVGFREARDAAGYSRGEGPVWLFHVPAVGTDEQGVEAPGPFRKSRPCAGRCRAEQEPAAAKVSRLRMDHGKANATATVASIALPPCRRISRPISLARGWPDTTMARGVGDARAAEQRPVEWNAGGVLLAGERCGRGDSAGKKQNRRSRRADLDGRTDRWVIYRDS